MIDPSFEEYADTLTAAENARVTTHDLLQIQIDNLTTALEKKTKDHEFVRDQLQRHVNQVSSFEGALKNNEWDFDFETLSDLAGYFDIELNREYDVTITVRWSGTVTAPMHFDMEEIENFLDIRIDTDYRTSDAIIDLYQDEFDIDYNEVG